MPVTRWLMCFLVLLLARDINAQSALQVDELVDLMTAKRQEIKSLRIEFDKKSVEYPGSDLSAPGKILLDNCSNLLLWTPKHSYFRSQRSDSVLSWEYTDKWNKRLDEYPPDKSPKAPVFDGIVERGYKNDLANAGHPFFDSVWTIGGVPLEHFVKTGADITWDAQRSLYVLRQSVQAMKFVLTVDPKLGYMPTSSSYTDRDGNPSFESEFSDYREVAPGIWVPGAITKRTYEKDSLQERVLLTRFDRVVVNGPIDDNEMRITFPPGTRVDDRILGERYTIANSYAPSLPDGDTGGLGEPRARPVYSEDLYAPAKDADLAEVATRVEVQVHTALPFLPSRLITRLIVGGILLAVLLYWLVRLRRRPAARKSL